jgi:hypothetical protein
MSARARQIADGKARGRSTVLGIGVDEASGIVIDRRGIGTLLVQWKGGSAYLIRGGTARGESSTAARSCPPR